VQHVNVIPRADFGVDRAVAEGETVTVPVTLNGPAVEYPVEIAYAVSGTATNPDDHDAASGVLSIPAGTAGSLTIHVAKDFVYEGEESIVLALGALTNAVPGAQSTQTLTITQANVKPDARITVKQGGRPVTTATTNGGPITISAVVIDPNPGDAHTFDWSASDGGVFDPARFHEQGYTIDPAALAEGTYRLVLDVADDGSPIEANRVGELLRVARPGPPLSTTTDSDRDGISDAAEGAGDADGDRVPDYLDADSSPTVLRYSDDGFVLEGQPGHGLRLGSAAFAAGAAAELDEAAVGEEPDYGYPSGVADFEITGVEPGGSAKVVLPLRHAIPARAVYRKHRAGAWNDFVVDAANSIASAPGGQGACPQPGDRAYMPGINRGHACLELTIQDGGPNDADGLANGTIADPGGLAVPVGVTLQVLPVPNRTVDARVDTANVVLALRLESDSGDVQLESLKIAAFGSGDDRAVRDVRVYVDANGNGVVDGGEPAIGSGRFDRDDGVLLLRMSAPYVLPAGRTSLLVTYDF
jgi:hypothetical protein